MATLYLIGIVSFLVTLAGLFVIKFGREGALRRIRNPSRGQVVISILFIAVGILIIRTVALWIHAVSTHGV
jgi:hypothetical protein